MNLNMSPRERRDQLLDLSPIYVLETSDISEIEVLQNGLAVI